MDFFIFLHERGDAGVFFNGMLSSLIVAFHNHWSGWHAILTFVGWAQVLKGALSLTFPTIALRSLTRASHERAWEFRIAGAMFLVFLGVIAYGCLWRRWMTGAGGSAIQLRSGQVAFAILA